MDTEKKVQFVALTKEEIDAMIQQAALAGAQVASDAMMVGQRKSEKEKIDRRLHNTDLLLRNYRTLKASYENAVYKSKEGEVTEVLEDIMTMKDDRRAGRADAGCNMFDKDISTDQWGSCAYTSGQEPFAQSRV